jgi:uncharacterized repeat protein (TIGR04076 family)
MRKITCTAVEVENCSVFTRGQKMVINCPEIDLEHSDKICTHAITAFMPILTAIDKGAAPSHFGIGGKKDGHLRCIEPNGGVTFKLEVE